MSAENLLAIALAFFVVTVSPGPANLSLAAVAMSVGRRAGLHMSLGLALGLAFWGVIAATGFGALLHASSTALTVLKVAGALYLIWLAWCSARSALAPTPHVSVSTTGGRWFWRGLVLNLSNPKAVVAWMAALSMGLAHDAATSALTTATLVCMTLGLVNYVAHAMVFSLPRIMETYTRFRRQVEATVAALFALAGLALLRSALTRAP
ncbi:MAG: LysE family translocator [Pseudomonadota bacterium]